MVKTKGSPGAIGEKHAAEAVEALELHGSITKAASALGMGRTPFKTRINLAIKLGMYKELNNIDNPNKFADIPEILSRKKIYFDKLKRGTKYVHRIQLADDKPFVLMALGDPHLDNQGTDLELWNQWNDTLELDRWRGCCLGDLLDNWVGKLERLWSDNPMTKDEAVLLLEYYLDKYGSSWDWCIGGNHDKWPDAARAIKMLFTDLGVEYETDEMRIEYHTPSGHVVKVKARHNFKGRSMYSTDHGVKRDAMFNGSAYDVLLGGDLHVSGYTPVKSPEGYYSHAVQLGAFKIIDDYAKTCGFDDKHISPAVALVIDPRKDRTDFTRVRVFHDIDGAAIMLRGLMG